MREMVKPNGAGRRGFGYRYEDNGALGVEVFVVVGFPILGDRGEQSLYVVVIFFPVLLLIRILLTLHEL